MRDWMLSSPDFQLSAADEASFSAVLAARRPELLPSHTPKWVFLDWLTRQGYLLHGSRRGDLSAFEPRTPHDLSGDEFSSRTGVFATSDGLWAMMYALRGPQVRRMVNMALQVQGPGGFGPFHYFLSLAPQGEWAGTGRDLLSPGCVYVLPADGFEPAPIYEWLGLGMVREPQWVCPHSVLPLFAVAVGPDDFPLPVRLHDADVVDARCAADPWGFPWLDA